MREKNPFFSIIIPCYNSASYIQECLDSLTKQSFTDWEAIVVNDASSDEASEIIEQYTSRDQRIHLLDKQINEGLHLARRSGVSISSGKYVLFLDSDDALAEETLSKVRFAINQNNPDIFRFGLTCVEQNGMNSHSAREFEAWANSPSSVSGGNQLLEDTFISPSEYGRDWHVTHKAFRGDICRRAFSVMSDTRLERAEDSYEFLVLASMSDLEISDTTIRGYIYNIGRGVTTDKSLSIQQFLTAANQMKLCWVAANAFAEDNQSALILKSSARLKERLIFSLMNDWKDRIPEKDKLEAAKQVSQVIGNTETSVELMRFVRDEAYTSLGYTNSSKAFVTWFKLAKSLVQDEPNIPARYLQLEKAASRHVKEYNAAQELYFRQENHRVKIFASTHKDVNRFPCDTIQMIQVGSSGNSMRLFYCHRDDEGENISDRNPRYCELTAQYWAWKNVDADYYGFCHYRRYFDFSDTPHKENPYGEIIDDYIDAKAAKEYGLDDTNIERVVHQYDVITTPFGDLTEIIDEHGTPRALWEAAPLLHDDDLLHCYRILCKMYPDYKEDADAFFKGNKACFCNMFIMKKEIFFDYCSWMFPILEEFDRNTDYSMYSKEALRTPGHLSERLLNIYLMHHKRIGSNWKFKELQCVHFTNPEPAEQLKPLDVTDKPIIPVVFAADDNYVPQLTTTVYSAMKNADPSYFYDVTVLQRNISWDKQERMRGFFKQFPNMNLRFTNVDRELAGYELSTNNAHISVETYYRFLIQKVLPFYDKVLYLDSDIIINGDIAKLYNIDLQGKLLGAVRDIDFLGNLNVKHGKRMNYAKTVLKMKNPYDYFQAGVLVVNTKAMRERYTIRQWLTYASNPAFIYNDQDVLNAHCESEVLYLPWEWNVVHDCGGRVGNLFVQAPNDIYDAYMRSRNNPQIIHYAGFQKPWTDPDCDFASIYWRYARETPFYERLLKRVVKATAPKAPVIVTPAKPPRAVGEDNPIRKIIDPIMPIGSRRRELLKSIGRTARGRR